ncbi:MAG TPA: dihydroorotate dehydrogenase-like protein [Streptosporangiaceae bacterium]|jgi:dihydroorotate dehydrogenase (fumarate)
MDLSCQYLGLQLRNPLVASASPIAGGLDGVRRLAHAGLAAIVLPSLFEEEVRREAAQDAAAWAAGSDSFAESLSYFPHVGSLEPHPRRYLNLVERAAAAVDIPVIASLNCVSATGWTSYASQLEQAGAAAIELNIYDLPTDLAISGREVEDQHIEILAAVKTAVGIPVAVKLSPYYSAMGEMALRFDRAGADGLVLFNRFLHPDIDPERLATTTGFGLSSPADGRLPRVWIARLAGRVTASLAGSGGVEDSADVAAYLLAGADVVMTTSALLRHQAEHAMVLLGGLTDWMSRNGFTCLAEARGLLASSGPAAAAQERAGYARSLRAADRGERLG